MIKRVLSQVNHVNSTFIHDSNCHWIKELHFLTTNFQLEYLNHWLYKEDFYDLKIRLFNKSKMIF